MAEGVQVIAEPTPNPNSFKFSLDRVVIDRGSQSFRSPREAEQSPLAKRLFAVPGVQGLFLLNNFITVTREPDQDWDAIVPQVEAAIRDHYAGR
jgi:hypothetical protein